MLTIIKNNWNRLMVEKRQIIFSVLLTVFSVILAIVMTNREERKVNIAVLGDSHQTIESNLLSITYLQKEPKKSALMLNRYDAVVRVDANGSYKITTVKNEKFKNELEAILENRPVHVENLVGGRNIGTNIIGYMLMFVMMQGIVYTRFFGEDKEKHVAERISTSSLGFTKYIAGQTAFSWILIFVPTFSIILIANLMGASIGFALWQYVVLIAIISVLSTCFAVCIYSFFENSDTANMLGNSILIITSIISGSFYSMEDKAGIFHKILYVLPLKDFLHFAEDWEKQIVNPKDIICLIYVIICSVALAGIGVAKTRKEYSFRS